MAIKIKIPRGRLTAPAAGQKAAIVRVVVAAFLLVCIAGFGVFAYFYVKYDRIIDQRMKGQIFANSAKIYSRARVVRPGDKVTREQLETELKRAGYIEDSLGNPEAGLGSFREVHSALEIHPGPESFHSEDGATIYFAADKVDHVLGGGSAAGSQLDGYELEPQLLTALFAGDNRTKRQIVKFEDIPKSMVDATVSIEDRRFFQHSGVNYFRLAKAALIDLKSGEKEQGGSTLTMQMARAFFLNRQKSFKRKLLEMLIAIELEQKFTKQQIFELYANQVDMGQRGSYTIAGFAEASRAYFGKDLKNVTLPEAAMLAGIVQAPTKLSPYRHPERALERRNLVLEAMQETGAITAEQAGAAKATPLKLAPPNVEASDAPYFVDLVKDTLTSRYKESDINENAYRIYTTIDPELQHAAAEAVEIGIQGIDEQVKKQRTRKVKGKSGTSTEEVPGPIPQIALVALDPHTGEVLALVGGRNYGYSQLNHAIAKRPTGSIFKPFVYAAAMNTAITTQGGSTAQQVATNPPNATAPGGAVTTPQVFTPATLIDDTPTTFTFDDGRQVYEPRNYRNEYHGVVTARFALQESLNNATVRLAEMVGYDKVADLAREAGVTSVKATPAAALGAYDASPIEMSGAYTVFANGGLKLEPLMIKSVRDSKGDVIEDFKNSSKQILDPRVTYVMTRMMEAVINHGTGSTVRARGFTLPAAGKTGTSHDAWFAGYTTNLLCIVWVGYDDYSDLKLAGGSTAAPVWAEFMKRATALPQYRDVHDFTQPSGVIDVTLDKSSNLISTSSCPDAYTTAFIAGTEPTQNCDTGKPNLIQRMLGMGGNQQPQIINGPPKVIAPGQTPGPGNQNPANAQAKPAQPEPKKGFWGKVLGVFKGDDKKQEEQKSQPEQPHSE